MEDRKTVSVNSDGYVKSAHVAAEKEEIAGDDGKDLLNLIAEIIIEIILKEANERNRIYKKK